MIKYTGTGKSGVKINGVEVNEVSGVLEDVILRHEKGWERVDPGAAKKVSKKKASK